MRFWPRFGRLRDILKILKDFYNPRLKSVWHGFSRWAMSRINARKLFYQSQTPALPSSAHRIHLICCLFYINTGCAAVFMRVCRAAYTILLKYAGIAAVHTLFMITNISVPRAMQFPVTECVWVDHVKLRTSFLARTRFLTRLDSRTVWH